MDYQAQYRRLNERQRQAVDHIDGPLLVIAGPGTGKTQLLAMRVGKILESTDTGPESILCISFTDAAVIEMKSRLKRLIGTAGNRVSVFTFHSFGSYVINRYPEYFFNHSPRDLVQLDDVARYQLIESLLDKLPVRHPYTGQDSEGKFVSVRAVQAGIAALKQAGLSVEQARHIFAENASEIDHIEPLVQAAFDVPRLNAKNTAAIEALADELLSQRRVSATHAFPTLSESLGHSLTSALEATVATGKTADLGAWRDAHLTRRHGVRRLKASLRQADFAALIDLYEAYQQATQSRGVYDYDDMILWVNQALAQHEDLRLSLAENYLYIMVDEYQDTNGAQNQLLRHLSGIDAGIDLPNIMTVGDDDQAIMRFQGAETSHMWQFISDYALSPNQIITLTDNYRSSPELIKAARAVVRQIPDRLESAAADMGIQKNPVARSEHSSSLLAHFLFDTKVHEFSWIASRIRELLNEGVSPDNIAVIAPKHRVLVEIASYLQQHNIPLTYDRRENIIDQPLMLQLVSICQCIEWYNQGQLPRADALLPRILSFPFWGITSQERLSLLIEATRSDATWFQSALNLNGNVGDAVSLLLAIAPAAATEPAPIVIDMLLGLRATTGSTLKTSPFYEYYFGTQSEETQLVTTMTQLTTLQRHLEGYFGHQYYRLSDFLRWIELLRRAEIPLVNTSHVTPSTSSVQVMSAHGSKGREFGYVFLAGVTQELWGAGRSSGLSRAYLPENLPIYPAGNAPEDRARLFFVALTRAKHHAFLSSHRQRDNGKPSALYDVVETAAQSTDDWPQPVLHVVPTLSDTSAANAQRALTQWRAAYDQPSASLDLFLRSKLESYSLSPTHLRDFLDITRGGPQVFKQKHLLRLPESKSFHARFGSAVHRTLESVRRKGAPKNSDVTDRQLADLFSQHLRQEAFDSLEFQKAFDHGIKILVPFYHKEKDRFSPNDQVEVALSAILEGDVKINGKIDVLTLDPTRNSLTVTDYKTGKPPHDTWSETGLSAPKKVSLHFNRLQVVFYLYLVSLAVPTAKHTTTTEAVLKYIEPDLQSGNNVTLTLLASEIQEEIERLQRLITAIWSHITELNFPDVSAYSSDIKGILAFENDLIENKI